MSAELKQAIPAVDRFARRLINGLSDEATGFSPIGPWPLLAILADAANDKVREEIYSAMCISHWKESIPQALALLKFAAGKEGLDMAVAVWLANDIVPNPDLTARLPPGVVQSLSGDYEKDEALVQAWVRQNLPLLGNYNLAFNEETKGYLASTVSIRTQWINKFKPDGDGWLMRESVERCAVRASEDVTLVRVEGYRSRAVPPDGVHHVYLVLGKEGAPANEVLSLGLDALRNLEPLEFDPLPLTRKRGLMRRLTKALNLLCKPEPPDNPSPLPPLPPGSKATDWYNDQIQPGTIGPGLRLSYEVREAKGAPCFPMLSMRVPRFHLDVKHRFDPALCGLSAALQDSFAFPGLSDDELLFDTMTQTVSADFNENGFTASVLSDTGLGGGCDNIEIWQAPRLEIKFDRPFGLLVVDPGTEVLEFVGWVTEKQWAKV